MTSPTTHFSVYTARVSSGPMAFSMCSRTWGDMLGFHISLHHRKKRSFSIASESDDGPAEVPGVLVEVVVVVDVADTDTRDTAIFLIFGG